MSERHAIRWLPPVLVLALSERAPAQTVEPVPTAIAEPVPGAPMQTAPSGPAPTPMPPQPGQPGSPAAAPSQAASPSEDAWTAAINARVAQERATETDEERARREELRARNAEDTPERRAERAHIDALRSRVRPFVALEAGYSFYVDYEHSDQSFGSPSPSNPVYEAEQQYSGARFGAGAGARIGLSSDFQLNLEVFLGLRSGTETDVYYSDGTVSFYGDISTTETALVLVPTLRLHFSPYYVGLGGYGGHVWIKNTCKGVSNAVCDDALEESALLVGGVIETGYLFLPDESLDVGLRLYPGTNNEGGLDLGAGLFASYAFL